MDSVCGLSVRIHLMSNKETKETFTFIDEIPQTIMIFQAVTIR